jgi:hypothetical protein
MLQRAYPYGRPRRKVALAVDFEAKLRRVRTRAQVLSWNIALQQRTKCTKWRCTVVAVSSAPFERDFELAVITAGGSSALFPCSRVLDGCITTETKQWVDVALTHWREWMRTP